MDDVVTSVDEESMESEENECVSEENEVQNGNPRLADALAKALRMGKNKKGKAIVLSKAKLYSPKTVTKKSHGFEIVPDPNRVKLEEEKNIKPEPEFVKPDKKELKKSLLSRKEKFERGRLKPSPLDREKERPLIKIATKGVVQLFNAVRQQQSAINKQINKPGVTEGKKEKILKSIDKKTFLDVLMGKSNGSQSQSNPEKSENIEVKSEAEDGKEEEEKEMETESSWQVLRDDFMMGAKLKDWDKKEIELEEE